MKIIPSLFGALTGAAALLGDPHLSNAAQCDVMPDFEHAAPIARSYTAALEMTDRAGRKTDAAGFFLSPDGRLATAAHAIAGAARIVAIMPDGARAEAAVIGADELSDIAVVRVVSASGVASAHFRAAPLAPGARVAAVGSPLGYRGTLTAGVVSAVDRSNGATTPYAFIQHDAALNPGSSGGPLIDANGEVAGMNVAIADGGRRHVGIAFAVPARIVEDIARRLTAGAIPRPLIGLRLRGGAAIASAIPEMSGGGVLIEAVDPGSAAELSGLQAGDLILAADGHPLTEVLDLAKAIEPLAPGAILKLDISRDGKPLIRNVVLAARPATAPKDMKSARDSHATFGVAFARGSARIAAVAPGSAAARAGLARGDVIMAVGLRTVETGDQAARLVADSGGDRMALLMRRGGTTRYIVLGGGPEPVFGANAEAAGSENL